MRKLFFILAVLLFTFNTGWTIGDADRLEDYYDVEIGTIDDAVEVVQDTLDARLPWYGLSGVKIDTCTTADGDITPWIAGAHRLFTITGAVIIHAVYGVVGETLTEDGVDCTIELGVIGATDGIIATTDPPTTLAVGDIWTNSSTASLVPGGTPSDPFILNDIDIDLFITGADNVDTGYITIFVVWSPLPMEFGGAADGVLVRADWD